MALPNVSILLLNGQLGGLIQFSEGVVGLIGTGVAVSGKIGLSDPRQVFNLDEAKALGITLADNPKAYRQVKEFYDEAGDGAELYIMLVPDTVNQTTMLDVTELNYAVKLLNYAQGRIRLLFSFFAPPVGYTLVTTAGLDADVFTAITKAHALRAAYLTNHTPVAVVVEGRSYTGTAASLTDLNTLTKPGVGVLVGSTLNDKSASVGLLAGRLAKIPVQRKPSRVKDGSLNITEAYVGTATVESHTGLDTMHDKGYIVMRTFAGKAGYFFSGDATAAPATDDYRLLSRCRVMDKASTLAYLTYLDELDDEVIVNTDGTLEIGRVKYLEQKITDQINGTMTALGEISSVKCTINPAQNILSTNKLVVVLKLTPVGYTSEIEVQLGFDNPAL